MEFLSLESLSHVVGVDKNTLRKWIEDCNVYIPKTNLDNVTYYLPEAINVLSFIKKLSDKQYNERQIREQLAHSLFPVRMENFQEAYQTANAQHQENIKAIMQTIDEIISNAEDQHHRLEVIEEKQLFYDKLMKVIKQQTDEINDLKQGVDDLQRLVSESVEADQKVKT